VRIGSLSPVVVDAAPRAAEPRELFE